MIALNYQLIMDIKLHDIKAGFRQNVARKIGKQESRVIYIVDRVDMVFSDCRRLGDIMVFISM